MDIERLKDNLIKAYRMACVWVMAAASFAAAAWLGLDPLQQAVILQALPVQPWVVPLGVGALGVLARIIPQKSVTQ